MNSLNVYLFLKNIYRKVVPASIRGILMPLYIRFTGRYETQKMLFGNIKFKGQFYQDMFAYFYFKKGKAGKFYIDIGANDGINGSNSYAFEQLGWDGICIEPQPDVFKILRKNRKCHCYNAALSNKSGNEADFIKVVASNGLSGLASEATELQKKKIENLAVKHIQVKTLSFDDMMRNHPDINHIDFLSLDVEGAELGILKTIDYSKFTFGLMAVENNEPDGVLVKYLADRGYKTLIELGDDILFIREGVMV